MKATYNITNNIMKSLIILTSIFFIQISTSFAGGYNLTPSANNSIDILITTLAPTAPSSTDFSDAELEAADFSNLAPVVPSEADFNDTPFTIFSLTDLAPVNPAEADFNDADFTNFDFTALAPTTPSEADFND